ncbi:MAG: ASKHA domain-containing protein [Acidimicrobiales bacterium]
MKLADPCAGGPPGGHADTVSEHFGGQARVDLRFEPSGRQVRVPPGVTLFDAASWNGIAIDSTCGGHGTCKKCRVQITDGHVAPNSLDTRAFTADELRAGWRLACRVDVRSDLQVEVPPLLTRPKAATVGVGRKVILRPAVQKRYLELSQPSLSDQMTDSERLLGAMLDLELRVDLHALKSLSRVLRTSDFKVTAVLADDVLIDVEAGDTTDRIFAVAIDLGTTTCVATLLDLSTGAPLAVQSMLNKQQPFGGDVITRISTIMMNPRALEMLGSLAHQTLAELITMVCDEGDVTPAEVYEVAIAGNATMTHIALGIDPEPLGMAPFIMSARQFPELLASEIGVAVHPRARAVVFPALGAYVGGDITAGLLASGMDRDTRTRLFIDIGTNCEIVLGSADGLLATAAPAGPAFEGAQIRCGMRAADGAIEVVKMTPDGLTLQVIGDVEPVGLCGSGLVDAVAELVRLGLIDASGRLVTEEAARSVAPGLADRFVNVGEERVFVLYGSGVGEPAGAGEGDGEPQIYLSQRDVRELQFAKAAIATGWTLLLEDAGLEQSDVQQVLLAGSFGSYLSPASAVRLGLVPRLPVMRVVSAGNVAGEGAKMALLSVRERAGAMALLDEVEYVELSDRPDFNDRFIGQLPFPVA